MGADSQAGTPALLLGPSLKDLCYAAKGTQGLICLENLPCNDKTITDDLKTNKEGQAREIRTSGTKQKLKAD